VSLSVTPNQFLGYGQTTARILMLCRVPLSHSQPIPRLRPDHGQDPNAISQYVTHATRTVPRQAIGGSVEQSASCTRVAVSCCGDF
jgi:hypothetical protein